MSEKISMKNVIIAIKINELLKLHGTPLNALVEVYIESERLKEELNQLKKDSK